MANVCSIFIEKCVEALFSMCLYWDFIFSSLSITFFDEYFSNVVKPSIKVVEESNFDCQNFESFWFKVWKYGGYLFSNWRHWVSYCMPAWCVQSKFCKGTGFSLDSNGINLKLQSLQTAALVKSWKNFTLAMTVFLFIVMVVTAWKCCQLQKESLWKIGCLSI